MRATVQNKDVHGAKDRKEDSDVNGKDDEDIDEEDVGRDTCAEVRTARRNRTPAACAFAFAFGLTTLVASCRVGLVSGLHVKGNA